MWGQQLILPPRTAHCAPPSVCPFASYLGRSLGTSWGGGPLAVLITHKLVWQQLGAAHPVLQGLGLRSCPTGGCSDISLVLLEDWHEPGLSCWAEDWHAESSSAIRGLDPIQMVLLDWHPEHIAGLREPGTVAGRARLAMQTPFLQESLLPTGDGEYS